MRDLPNIEPSAFSHYAYVGYAGSAVWSITGTSKSGWLAIPRQADAPEHLKAERVRARTLTELSQQLAKFDKR